MRKALVVGIDKYPNSPLRGCCNDADRMEELLSCNGDGSPNFEVKLKKNVGTKGELRRLIEECFAKDEDVALFYYSGHGYIDAVGGYLVTPDYKGNDMGVSLQEIMAIVNGSKCRDKILILDSCHSGFLGSVDTRHQNTAIINEGVTILTASASLESSIEKGGHGVFTALLIEALLGAAADIMGHVTPGRIYAYIDKALGSWDQRPLFKTNVTRFTSLRDVIPQVDASVIRRLCKYFPGQEDQIELNPSFEPTNSPEDIHELKEPYADPVNTRIFADLQKLESIGLVAPVDESHMYYAAMNSKSCKLTAIGKQYWKLVRDKRI